MKKKSFFRAFKLLFKCAPYRVTFLLILVCLAGLLPSLNILITIKLINWIAQAIQNESAIVFSTLILILSLWAIVKLLSELTFNLMGMLQTLIVEKFSTTLMTELAQKLIKLKDLSFFETKENLVKIDMVKGGLNVRPLNYVFNLTGNLQRIINLISMFIVLFSIDYTLPFIMLFSTVPVFFISQFAGKKQWDKTEKLQEEKLKLSTYIKHGLDGEKAKDNFLFNFLENFESTYSKIKDNYLKQFFKIAHKGLFFSILTGIVSASITIALFIFMVFIVLKKQIEVGAVAGYIQAFMNTQYEIQDLATYGRWFFILNGYFNNYFDLLDWKTVTSEELVYNKKTHIVLDEAIKTIELKNVYFQYPNQNTNSYVINNLNLFIDRKKTYAVVGKNGSGKTTLIKLLLGFYQPQKGEIIINGNYNLKCLDLKSYREKISAVFQDFAIYSGYTINENIFLNPNFSSFQEQEKLSCVDALGVEFRNRLDGKYNNILGLQYGGEDLSGGQRQRLAALRAFLKPANMIFFDEPTSAIDPISENEFIDIIFKMSANRISVVVTHRMGSVRSCDDIIVIDEGTVVEKGNFENLMAKKSLFYELYSAQRKNFQRP